MKVCEFCGTNYKDDVTECESCGSTSFINKCNNCGTEFKEGNFCPKCGVKVGQKERICPSCGTGYYTAACPNCGYIPGKQGYQTTAANNGTAQAAAKPPRRLWLWVLGWLFIFPLPLTLILVKKQNMNKGLKYGIIIAAWALYALLMYRSSVEERNEEMQKYYQYSLRETTAVTEHVTEAPSAAATISIDPTEHKTP